MSVNMHAAMRAAVVTLLRQYGTSADIGLQVYEALPATIKPPTAYIDRLTERIDQTGIVTYQRFVRVQVMVLFREFAAGERADAARQKDAFCDGFLSLLENNFHAAGGTTLVRPVSVEDNPEFQLSSRDRGVITYFSARITVEGYVETT